MNVKIAAKEDMAKVSVWYKSGRTEEITCRPVVCGKRVSPSNESVTLLFYIDGS